ncbi:MAG: EAL domain-containing protein [Gammaproteobacteria bacterium]|nr:MAG: EAL domain-containing protein [Gammaproteobacteria bacterium]
MLSTATEKSPAANTCILVVNNDISAQQKIKNCLLPLAYSHVTIVESATNALHFLRDQPVDLVILDIDIPDMDGWRLSRLIRCGILNCRADLPIVIMASTWCERIAEITAREYGINYLIPLDHLDQLPTVVQKLAQEKKYQQPKPRVLVVEDSQDTSDLIERVLGANFDMEVAADGAEGLNAWKARRHDLVLLDVMLPSLSGRDILIEINRIDPRQPVVIMTAHTTIDQAEELMLLGAVDFLSKPFRPEQLRKVCDIAIRREDYLVSNAQFAQRVESLQKREYEYRSLYQSHHQLLDDLQSVVMELDEGLCIRFLNRTWEALTGYTIKHSVGRPIENFIFDSNEFLAFKTKFTDALREKKSSTEIELCLKDVNGQKIWTQLKISRSTNSEKISTFTVCLDNITERKKSQDQLNYLAMHDSLTGLYNRHYFEVSLEKLADEASHKNILHGLVYLDLDHFKVVNDTFGHQKGDEVLREMSSLLGQRIREPDILCRLGGDEFAVLLQDVDAQTLNNFAQEIQKIIGDFSFQLQEHRINLGCSIGITLIDGSVRSPEDHFKRADIALYVAKGRGRNLIHLYNSQDDETDELRMRINISQKIRKAISEDRMILYFQPIYDIRKDKISYYESLVRLRETDGTIVGPAEFIPALEAAGEMHLLDRWIIKLATRMLKDHPKLNQIAINLSAQAFKDESLVPTILEALKATGINPNRITFELTESASLFNLHITQRVIAELHNLGCSFSVDDFGSGFSSFSYLKELPADYIKLDGSFIKNLHKDAIDRALVKSMIQVIQALGKKAVAEFVENQEILDILKNMGIDFVQGYHIGRPIPVEQLTLRKFAQ